jgi:hypothetical protein
MSIQFQCLNTSCGQVLTVKDEFAGKKGRCPSCGAAVDIPLHSLAGQAAAGERGAADAEPVLEEAEAIPIDRPRRYRPPDEEELVAAEGDVSESGRGRRPSRHVDSERFRRRGLAGAGAAVAGVFTLILLALIPQMSWVFVFDSESRSSRFDNGPRGVLREESRKTSREDAQRTAMLDMMVKSPSGSVFSTGVGSPFLVFSVLVALLALLTVALAPALPADATDSLITTTGSTAVAWGVTAFFWIVGYSWRVFNVWSEISERGGDRPILGTPISSNTTVLPGIGLVLGMLATVLIVILFSYLLASRRRVGWILGAGALGFLLGSLLIVFSVKPWIAPFFLLM